MGQAKMRGTKEERIAKAKAKMASELGFVEKNVNDIKQEYEVPDNANFKGYVLYIKEDDMFLGVYEHNEVGLLKKYTRNPEYALVFQKINDLIEPYRNLSKKYQVSILYLFETENQILVYEV